MELVLTPDGGLEVRRADGSLIVGGVRLLPIVMHAPGQAFINLDGDCIHRCAFCTTHMVDRKRKKLLEPGKWVQLVLEAHARTPFGALAITGVAAPDHEAMMAAYEEVIEGVRRKVPDIKVGVEPYIKGSGDIERLKRAGADEIKINLQTPVQEILGRVCPGWSLERTYDLLEEAVRVFGRGRVTTNIIVGLGETDDDVRGALEHLASMGVIPSVRAIRLNALNRPALEHALGHPVEGVDPDRHIRLAIMLHEALERHGLDAGSLETMCHRCGCCDLEPGQDV
jgi:lipoate synthase